MLGYGADARESRASWPHMTMDYEMIGAFDKVGDAEPLTSAIGMRLTHYANGNWREEVISAPDVAARVGRFNREGSYQSVVDGVYTEYDAVTGETTIEKIEADEIRIPRHMIFPFPISKLDENYHAVPTLTQTTATVCFNEVCQENAPGWLYEDSERRYVYADDQRGIPISLSHLNITAVRIYSDQQAVVR